MTIEIRKEMSFADMINKHLPWYALYIDDKYVTGNYDLSTIEGLYEVAKKMRIDNKNINQMNVEILKSEKI